MITQRVVIVVTASVVAVLAVVLMVVRWDDANKIAVVMSAVAAVAAVGVGIWAGLPTRRSGGRLRVSRTGKATTGSKGSANTGLSASGGLLTE
ncbi:hypothetical protein ACFXKD_03355 [Nocardiopsis aegyptia]|uniref:hypothetical protein n=1 Tax=Nocardiopsis aegyptia TaxID=220378 RepID=UPI00366B5AAF